MSERPIAKKAKKYEIEPLKTDPMEIVIFATMASALLWLVGGFIFLKWVTLEMLLVAFILLTPFTTFIIYSLIKRKTDDWEINRLI